MEECSALGLDQVKIYTHYLMGHMMSTGWANSQDQLFVSHTGIPIIVFLLTESDFTVRVNQLTFHTSQLRLTVEEYNHLFQTLDMWDFIKHYNLLLNKDLPSPTDIIHLVLRALLLNPYIVAIRPTNTSGRLFPSTIHRPGEITIL